jgi:hypothetical protein
MVLAHILIDGKWDNNYLAISYISLTSLNTLLLFMVAVQKGDSGVCSGNATGLSARDGISICAVQGVILVYTMMGCSIAYAFQAVDIFWRIYFNKSTLPYQRV